MNANDVDMSKVNRLEVIDEDGRSYVNWQGKALGIEMSLQDEGRTIKVFTKGRSNAAAKEEQARALTDEGAHDIAEREIKPQAHLTFDELTSCRHGFEMGLRYARDNGYLAPAKGSGWISVEDRLPEPKTFVLTWSWKRGYTVEWMANDVGWDLDPPPTYWMPIPTVPDK